MVDWRWTPRGSVGECKIQARWLADAKGPNSHTTWNIYLKYFAANKETEVARIPIKNPTVHSVAFHAQGYVKYQEEVSDWQGHDSGST